MRETTLLAVLLPIRLFAGWVFLRASIVKLAGGWFDHPKLQAIVEGWLQDDKPYSFFAPFLRSVVLPNAQLFGRMVALGELAVGCALLLGLVTRAAAAGGLFLTLMFLLARGDGLDGNPTAPFVVMMLTLLLSHSGRTLGVDAALAHRLPRWLT